MGERPLHWPGTFDEFQRSRTQAMDRMAPGRAQRELEHHAASVPAGREGMTGTLVVDGDLTVLGEERRLVMGYFRPGSRDLADLVRRVAKASDAFGITHVGPVRISVEPQPTGSAGASATPA
jgi:hypothetical protein